MNTENQITLIEEIRHLLECFQDGYTCRDPAKLDEFMQLFSTGAQVEVIGTNGVRPGVDEWYTDTAGARQLIQGDWESWGAVRLALSDARIQSHGEVAWLSVPGTVTMHIPAEQNYHDFLEHVQRVIDSPAASAEETLLYILRGGINTVYELRRGETFVWPLRFTAVVVREPGSWKFRQMQFSLPTIYFPDVRLV
jgi:hypothetical protein